MKCKETGRST